MILTNFIGKGGYYNLFVLLEAFFYHIAGVLLQRQLIEMSEEFFYNRKAKIERPVLKG